MSKIKVIFLKDTTEFTGDGEDNIEYKKGKTYSMSEESAGHWIALGEAEIFNAEKAKAEKEAAEAQAKAEKEADK